MKRLRRVSILAFIAVVSSLAPVVPATAGKAPSCTLAPVLRDFAAMQGGVGGTGGNTPLVRNKETLFRAYFSKPSCAPRTSTLSLTGATLTMTIGGVSRTYSPLDPLSATSPAPLQSYDASPQLNGSSDPKFVIPPEDFISATADAFTATYSLTVSYTGTASGTLSNITRTDSAVVLSTPVDKRSNAIRLLVVPMGEALTTDGTRTLEAALNALSRMLPVPKAGGQLIGPLSSTSNVGGIRYAVNAGVVQLPSTPYCGSSTTFSQTTNGVAAIRTQLAGYRSEWNLANSANSSDPNLNPTADFVLGVGAPTASDGTALVHGANDGCAEGVASVSSPEGWIRLTPDISGATAAMEIAHTLGLRGGNGGHSINSQADGGNNRAYNVTTRQFQSADTTVMNSNAPGFGDSSGDYEPADFNFLRCRLGGAPAGTCSTSGTTGTTNGVLAGPVFVMSGNTDGACSACDGGATPTAAGTEVLTSRFSLDVAITEPVASPYQGPVPSSPYRLVYKQGDTTLADYGVLVQSRVAVEGVVPNPDESPGILATGGDETVDADQAAFSIAYPFIPEATRIALVYQPTGDVLYARNRNGSPTLKNFSVAQGGAGSLINYTSSESRDDRNPAVNFDGDLIAWTTAVGSTGYDDIHVGYTDDPTAFDARDQEGFDSDGAAFWNPTENEVGWVNGTTLFLADVTTTETGPQIGTPEAVFTIFCDGQVCDPNSINNPSFSADGRQIVFDDGSNLFLLTLGPDGGLSRLTTSNDSTQPTWLQIGGTDYIAYVREFQCGDAVGCTGSFGPDIYTIEADPLEGLPEETATLRFEDASAPSAGSDGKLSVTVDEIVPPPADCTEACGPGRQSAIYLLTPGETWTAEPINGTDSHGGDSSYAGNGVAAWVRYAGDLNGDGQIARGFDVMLLAPGGEGTTISVAGGTTGDDKSQDALDNLRLTIHCQMAGVPESSALLMSVPPDSTSGPGTADAEAQWDVTLENTGACDNLIAILDDGFTGMQYQGQTGFDVTTQVEDVDPNISAPVASIISPDDVDPLPSDPTRQMEVSFLEWQAIPLQGEGQDGLGRQVADAQLRWTITGGGLSSPLTFNGSTVDVAPLGAGDYLASLEVSEDATFDGCDISSPRSECDFAHFHVLTDADRDALSENWENAFGETAGGCLGATPDSDPFNGSDDHDGDGIATILEIYNGDGPCVATTDTADFNWKFDPETLYVPSKGEFVTVYINQVDHHSETPASLIGGSVRMKSITGIPSLGLTPVTKNVLNESFSGNRLFLSTLEQATVKFDRQGLNSFIQKNFKMGQQITFEFVAASANPAFTTIGSAFTTIKKGR